MAIIYETQNFIVETHERPEVDRLEGGHIKITPKVAVKDRTELTPELAKEMARLTMMAGEAMKMGMAERGVEIGRINYQDNGNWRPELHIHLYGRAVNAAVQKYGDPIKPGHQEEFRSLDEDDITAIRDWLEELAATEKYREENW